MKIPNFKFRSQFGGVIGMEQHCFKVKKGCEGQTQKMRKTDPIAISLGLRWIKMGLWYVYLDMYLLGVSTFQPHFNPS